VVDAALKDRAKTARDWMLSASLPFWADRGVHPHLGFHERLTATGETMVDDDTRVRLQARQTFCFAYGKALGWNDSRADELIARGLGVLRDHCRRPDGLYGSRMSYTGGLSVDSANLYDCAFALLAFSWAYRVGADEALDLGLSLHNAIESELKRPASEGGYRETLPVLDVRLQNPHMHLFESSLAFFEATGDQGVLNRALALETLLEKHFLEPSSGALREKFSMDWGPAEGDRYEAGHQYEWVWLMSERTRLSKTSISTAADALYRNAVELTGPGCAVALSHTLSRDVLDATERTWGLTEALKAHTIRILDGDKAAEAMAIETFDRMWTRHIEPAPEGGWLDKYGPDGQPDLSDMTAATGYHIYVAIGELARIEQI